MNDPFLLNGIIAVVATSLAGFLLHCLINLALPKPRADMLPIGLILRQGKLLGMVWLVLAPLGWFLYLYLKDKFIWSAFSVEIAGYIYGLLFFGCLFFHYMSIYYIIDRSVSSRIMIAINHAPEHRLTLKEIEEVYDIDHKYQTEFKGMIEGGFVTEKEGLYRNTLKGTALAKFVGFFKIIFKMGLGGY